MWIRDLATFLPLALQVNSPAICAKLLIGFLERQHADGEVPGGYLRGSALPAPTAPFPACLGGISTCKNTCESDQESSLVLAVEAYVNGTRDVAFLAQRVHGSARSHRTLAARHIEHGRGSVPREPTTVSGSHPGGCAKPPAAAAAAAAAAAFACNALRPGGKPSGWCGGAPAS